MKTIFLILVGLCLPVMTVIGQVFNHPVIDKVQAVYKPVPVNSVTVNPSGPPDLKVKATLNVTLKEGNDAAKIYLKILNKQNNTVVYEVNYSLGSADVTENGLTLFRKQGNSILVSNPDTVSLKPYIYEIYTKDAQNISGPVYTIIQ